MEDALLKRKWDETCERSIAFFDIMGFKNFVYENEHSDVHSLMIKIDSIIKAVHGKIFTSNEHKELVSVRTAFFSDSIIIVSNSSSIESLNFFLLVCSWVNAVCIRDGIPIKGAISHGLFTADFQKSLFFGKPLIEAYQLQENLHIYGCVLSHSIEKKITSESKPYLWHLPVPFKGSQVWHYILNWTNPLKIGSKLDAVKLLFKFYMTVSGLTRKYVDNSIRVIDEVLNEPNFQQINNTNTSFNLKT